MNLGQKGHWPRVHDAVAPSLVSCRPTKAGPSQHGEAGAPSGAPAIFPCATAVGSCCSNRRHLLGHGERPPLRPSPLIRVLVQREVARSGAQHEPAGNECPPARSSARTRASGSCKQAIPLVTLVDGSQRGISCAPGRRPVPLSDVADASLRVPDESRPSPRTDGCVPRRARRMGAGDRGRRTGVTRRTGAGVAGPHGGRERALPGLLRARAELGPDVRAPACVLRPRARRAARRRHRPDEVVGLDFDPSPTRRTR